MSSHSYPTTRRHFLTTLGTLVGTAYAGSTKNLQASPTTVQETPNYNVHFSIRDEYTIKLQDGLAPNSRDDTIRPIIDIPVTGSRDYIRRVYQHLLERETIPATTPANNLLERLINSLLNNPQFLQNSIDLISASPDELTEEGVATEMIFNLHTGSYDSNPSIAILKIEGKRTRQGLLDIDRLVEAGASVYFSGYRNVKARRDLFAYEESWLYRSDAKKGALYASMTAEPPDSTTLPRIDLQDHRRRITEGLKRQIVAIDDLRFGYSRIRDFKS